MLDLSWITMLSLESEMPAQYNYVFLGFYLYIFTDIFFETWRKKILWKQILILLVEPIIYSLLAIVLSAKYPDLTEVFWIASGTATILAIIMPFISTIFLIIKTIIIALVSAFWRSTHIKQIFIATDAKNVWIKYLIITTT